MCVKLCFLFHTLYVDERDCCQLFATEDCYFILHECVVCVCAYNDFGQQHPTPVTPATKATPHMAHTSHVPSCMPRICPHPTRTLKCSNMLQSNNARDTLVLYKACTKECVSSMPMDNQRNEIDKITEHLLTLTYAAKATVHKTHWCCTRQAPRRLPHPCPCTASIIKINNNDNNNHLISPWQMLKGWNSIAKMYSSAQWNLLTNIKSIACLSTHTDELNNIGCECNNLNNHYALMQTILRIKNAKRFWAHNISFPTTSILSKATSPKKFELL